MDQPRRFATTRWSLVVKAGQRPTPESREALSALCQLYWYPLYAFVRRSGRERDDATDLTQSFFTRLLEKNDLAAARADRGRFRSWLLGAMKHFLANEWDKETAQKRGGRDAAISLDALNAEGRYLAEPIDELDPEKLYQLRFVSSLDEQVRATLAAEHAQRGKSVLFERLEGTLTGEPTARYEDIGRALGMTEDAVKQAADRLRKRRLKLLREAVADTVMQPDDKAEVDAEFDALISLL